VLKLPVVGEDSEHWYQLRGLIYGGDFHFTSRIVDKSGQVWYADGMTNGKQCIFERTLAASDDTQWLKTCQGRRVLYVIYENTTLHQRQNQPSL
jgi:hypothetical protein